MGHRCHEKRVQSYNNFSNPPSFSLFLFLHVEFLLNFLANKQGFYVHRPTVMYGKPTVTLVFTSGLSTSLSGLLISVSGLLIQLSGLLTPVGVRVCVLLTPKPVTPNPNSQEKAIKPQSSRARMRNNSYLYLLTHTSLTSHT